MNRLCRLAVLLLVLAISSTGQLVSAGDRSMEVKIGRGRDEAEKDDDAGQQTVKKLASEMTHVGSQSQQQQLRESILNSLTSHTARQTTAGQLLIPSARLRMTLIGETFSSMVMTHGKLYAARYHNPLIEVFNATTFNLITRLRLDGLDTPTDMASCPDCDFIYIVDYSTELVLVINGHGLVRTQWNITRTHWSDKPFAVSINVRSNAVVTTTGGSLQEFTSTGRPVRHVRLQLEGFVPRHAIQLSEDRYIVAHRAFEQRHQLCIVNGSGAPVLCNNNTEYVGRWEAYHLALLGESLLFVADHDNYRVLVFEVSFLRYLGVLIDMRSERTRPWRLALDEDGTRLYVIVYRRQSIDEQTTMIRVFDLVNE